MKPVRIALVSDAVLPFNKGGKETRIYHLTKELVKSGFQVDIYTMRWWEKGRTYSHEGITYHALCRKYELYDGNRRSIKQGVLFGIACLKMLFYSFDILEVDQMPYFPLYAAKLVCFVRRKQLYATWHEVWGHDYWKVYLGRFKGSIAYAIERVSVCLPNHIFAVSDHTMSLLHTTLNYKGEISLVANGIDNQHIKSIVPARTKNDLIYAGRLLPHKNVDLLILAVYQLRLNHPDITCRIVGDGPEYGRLNKLVRSLRLEKHVTFSGFMETSDEVLAAMKSSRILVMPSDREGFGVTVLEAFACGLQVVSVNSPANAAQYLVTPGTGIVCEPNSTAIAQSVTKLLNTKPTVATTKVSQNAAAYYDWRQSAQVLGAVYAS